MPRITWAIGLLLLGGVAALIWASRPAPPSGRPDVARLQALATQSCRCARRTEDKAAKGACWHDFERQVAPYRPSRYSTMCDPVSPSGYCFGEPPGDCVAKEYSVSPETASLCSADEARIAEAAFNEAAEKAPNDRNAPFKAFYDTARALARGDKLASSAPVGGCAG